MQDLEQTIQMALDFVRRIWIKKRFVIIFSWLICPIGFLFVSSLPNEYQSDARVFVDTRSVLQSSLEGMVMGSNPELEVAMMAKTLLSRSNVEKIARAADLDITAKTDAEYSQLITDLTEDINLQATRNEDIYTIVYSHESPELAKTVVQETLDLFVEGTLGNNRADSQTTARFFDEQIAEYELRLAKSEQRVADFRRQYSDILPLSGTFHGNLQSLRQQLEDTRLTIKETTQQIESMKTQTPKAKQAADGLSVRNQSEQVLKTRYDDRIIALEGRLDELKLRFTEQHPDVVESTNLLEALKEAREREIQVYKSQETDDDSLNLLTESDRELRLEITRLEGLVASLKVRETDTVNKIEGLQSKIDLVPQVEAEETALNRDYGILKNQYEELLSRREATNLTESADRSSDDFQFRIIRPPLVPDEPTGPTRILFYTAVLVMGFGAGVGVAFLTSMLSPVLVRGRQIQDLTGFPIWGAVSHLDIVKIKKRNRFRIAVFALSSGTIVAIYAMFVLLDIMNINLLSRLPI
jgi:polysaccharide chain length determinant protein (PEP-CTERM system associated)